MEGEKLIEALGCIEFSFLQTLGFGTAAFGNQILCNGANLLFRRAAFLAVNEQRLDYNEVSGDDLFLLAAFKAKKFDIKAISSDEHELTVFTAAPKSFNSLLSTKEKMVK